MTTGITKPKMTTKEKIFFWLYISLGLIALGNVIWLIIIAARTEDF